jgi:cytochrome c5
MKTSQMIFAAGLVAAIALGAPQVHAQTSDNSAAAAAAAQQRAEHAKLFLRGAKLWPIYCNTCHNARPASDFSPAEWNMIMMHMRTQANLPAEDAKAILVYLQQR